MNNPFKEIELKPVQLVAPVVETMAQEAKRLLEPIPDELWCRGSYRNENLQSCALGHYALQKGYNGHYSCVPFHDFTLPLRDKSAQFIRNKFSGTVLMYHDIASINNLPSYAYPQPTHKARVMALLDDMIAAGY